jgi:hypothetical protein
VPRQHTGCAHSWLSTNTTALDATELLAYALGPVSSTLELSTIPSPASHIATCNEPPEVPSISDSFAGAQRMEEATCHR